MAQFTFKTDKLHRAIRENDLVFCSTCGEDSTSDCPHYAEPGVPA